MMQTKVYEESFYFNVLQNDSYTILDNTNSLSTQKNKVEKVELKKEEKKVIKEKKVIEKNRYTIQVASWTSLDKAKKDMKELINLGFDTYIEEYFDKKNNILRWRVRIGSFESKKLAIDVKKRLAKFRGEDPWIAFIK